ncbi:response regulator [Candidatus Riflebacteria bacterium]
MQKETILLVDDDPIICKAVGKVLKENGFKVSTAANGSVALDLLEKNIFDLVITDLVMEKVDGLQVLESAKESNPDTGVFILTGYGDLNSAISAIRHKADDYLLKPCGNDELIFRITGFFEKQALKRQIKTYTNEVLPASEARFKAVADYTCNWESWFNTDGKLLWVNPAVEDITGYTALECQQMHDYPFPIIEEKDRGFLKSHLKSALKTMKSEKRKSFRIKHKDGSTRWGAISWQPIFDRGGEYIGIRASVREITEQKQFEKELLLARTRAEKATEMKDKFISLLAHDLKSPLTSIIGLMNIILKKMGDSFSRKNKELFDMVIDCGNYMEKMVEELLSLSRMQCGKVVPNSRFLDLKLLTEVSIDSMIFLARKKGIVVKNEIPQGSRIYADFQLLSEVVQNLFSNAIKFSSNGDTITFFIPAGKNSSIAIKDTGTGIKKKFMPDLFKHEIKTSIRGTAGERGTGLGLPFCKEIIKAHNGMLSVDSKENEGSVFTISLPEVNPRILIIDDEDSSITLLQEILKPLEVEIIAKNNGKDALKILKKETINIILCDIHMPQMDGFEFLQIIREGISNSNIPVIMMTVDNAIETRERVFALGARDFIQKPINTTELIPRLRKYIS